MVYFYNLRRSFWVAAKYLRIFALAVKQLIAQATFKHSEMFNAPSVNPGYGRPMATKGFAKLPDQE